MEANKILQAELLDILFENRNKNYGAYILRKDYNKRLYQSLALMFLSVSGLCFFISYTGEKNNLAPMATIETVLYKLPVPQQNKKKTLEKTPIQKPAAKKNNTQIFVSNLKIVDSNAVATKLSKNLDSVAISNITQVGFPGTKPLVKFPTGPVDSGNGTKNIPKVIDNTNPRITADIMPAFPGGIAALRQFLERNLSNPSDINQGEVISVKIQFVVGYDGKLKGFEVIEDGGTVFNKEVIRVLKKMPQWIPGKAEGENVSVYYTIPVKFVSQE